MVPSLLLLLLLCCRAGFRRRRRRRRLELLQLLPALLTLTSQPPRLPLGLLPVSGPDSPSAPERAYNHTGAAVHTTYGQGGADAILMATRDP
eukprot:COSAG01_NODE_1868_length_9028_cov_3.001232_14_plen_92_part_00